MPALTDIIGLVIAGFAAIFLVGAALLASYDRQKGAVIAAVIGAAILIIGVNISRRASNELPAVSAKE